MGCFRRDRRNNRILAGRRPVLQDSRAPTTPIEGTIRDLLERDLALFDAVQAFGILLFVGAPDALFVVALAPRVGRTFHAKHDERGDRHQHRQHVKDKRGVVEIYFTAAVTAITPRKSAAKACSPAFVAFAARARRSR